MQGGGQTLILNLHANGQTMRSLKKVCMQIKWVVKIFRGAVIRIDTSHTPSPNGLEGGRDVELLTICDSRGLRDVMEWGYIVPMLAGVMMPLECATIAAVPLTGDMALPGGSWWWIAGASACVRNTVIASSNLSSMPPLDCWWIATTKDKSVNGNNKRIRWQKDT